MYASIGIVGLGLMGGSLAKLIRQHFPLIQLVGLDVNEAAVTAAKLSGLFNGVSSDISYWPGVVDLVFVATPMDSVLPTIQRVSQHLKEACVITDIASVKGSILQGVERFRLPHTHTFIGGHPIAGTEYTGFQYSSADILQEAPYVLVPTRGDAYLFFAAFLKGLGFKVIEMSAEMHDLELARISHLPYVVAQLLMQVLMKAGTDLSLVGPSFCSATRVAASDPRWGEAICRLNKSAVLSSLREFRTVLDRLEMLINADQKEMLVTQFKQAQDVRRSL